MKSLLSALATFVMFLSTGLPLCAQTASSPDTAWASYFKSLETAVVKHDKPALKALIASRILYEDGAVSDTRFLQDFGDEGGQLLNALKTGKVSGSGTKRLLKSEAGDIDFVFAKGKWYLKAFNVGG